MAAMSAISTVLVAPKVGAVTNNSNRLLISSNGRIDGLQSVTFVRARRELRPLLVRAGRDPRIEDNETLVDKAKEVVNDVSKNIQDALTGSGPGHPAKPIVGSPGRKPGAGRSEQPEHKSSTGGVTQKAVEMAEKTAAVFDGVREDIESKLKDNGRDLKSKTGDVVYGSHRNADNVPSDVVAKTNAEQTKYTKGL